MNAITTTEPVSPAFQTGLAIFDSGQFENLYRVAEVLGKSSLIPDSLKGKTEEETTANCLLVVEQSHRWKLSPFAVAQCASVVYGRLMWEGKLVHAVIQSLSGINLVYDISGDGEEMQVIVSGTLRGEDKPRTVKGTVKQWKTTGNGSPWTNPADHPRQLRYRGAREWSRAHDPAVMLGILVEDEALPELVNVTNGRTPAKRETPNIPGPAAKQEEESAKADTVKHEATGRQKKDRFEVNAKFKSITERTSDKGKTWFDIATIIVGKDGTNKQITLTTFSTTFAESLRELEAGTMLRVVLTQSGDGFALEDYKILEEEGLV